MSAVLLLLALSLAGSDWQPLTGKAGLSGWHEREEGRAPWQVEGGVLRNSPSGKSADLITDEKFGDVELYLEFRLPRPSNSGVYLHGLYEVQILDDRRTEGGLHDCGAIYQRWINGKGVGGKAPLRNACTALGTWQSFHIWFRAPRFQNGRKVENARFLRVEHNGAMIHENVEVDGPTRASLDIPEAARNPLMLQGDHGPVEFRRIRVRSLPNQPRPLPREKRLQ